MSDKIEKIGETRLNSSITNVFSKQSIQNIRVTYRNRMFNLGWIAEGVVEFKNGNTEATQRFEGESFDEVTRQIKHFIDNEL